MATMEPKVLESFLILVPGPQGDHPPIFRVYGFRGLGFRVNLYTAQVPLYLKAPLGFRVYRV